MDPPDTDDAPEASGTGRRRPPRRHVVVVGILVGALVVANNVGNIFITTLAEDHPAWLLLLNSTNRTLALTTNQLDAFSYYGIATVRLFVADPLFFLLGVWYGDAVIRWVERRSASQGDVLRMFERGFDKAAYPLVFLAPNNVVCLLVLSAVLVIGSMVRDRRAGRGELDAVREMDEELGGNG